ncbi:uncharacterized protein LOC134834307 [Culicoides brevitarsis]|uniref:uncharacterized protein LOC134834307 n=1 Tax=Culicoides brevitarsis TaxID=469753 RepID=UPI00307C7A09
MELPSLMDLNDDCLEMVLKNFDLEDLLEIRDVCPRLDAVINRFRRKFTNFNTVEHRFITKDNIAKVLEFLGPTMKSLECKPVYQMNRVALLAFVGMFCTTLEKLVLNGFGGYLNPLSSFEIFQLMTPRLKSFTIDCTILSSDFEAEIFDNAPNLEEFVLKCGEQNDIKKLFTKQMNLKSLSFIEFDSLKPKVLKEALKFNLILEKLILAPNNCCSLHNTLIKYISKNLTNLTELAFVAHENLNYVPFADLPKLKKLTVEIDSCSDFDSVLKKLSEKNIIEELHIIPNDFDIIVCGMDFELFGKLTNLKKFSLQNYEKISKSDLKELEKLSKLESLSVRGAENLAFDGLLKLVANNPMLKSLDASRTYVEISFLKPLLDVLKKSSDRPKLEFSGFYKEDEEDLNEILKGNSKFISLILEEI